MMRQSRERNLRGGPAGANPNHGDVVFMLRDTRRRTIKRTSVIPGGSPDLTPSLRGEHVRERKIKTERERGTAPSSIY